MREALVVTCGYLRQNIIEDVWADIFDVDQSTISRYVTFLTPFVEKATEEDRPSEEDAAEATRGAIVLVDGTLWPCWSWDGENKLWSGKYKTTGVHSRGAVNGCQFRAGSGGSQGLPSMAARMASRAVMPWAAAESR